MGAEDVIGFYRRHAREWVGDRGRQSKFIEKKWLDGFTALTQPAGTILDLGCGPGKPIAAYLLSNGFKICGVDSSPEMTAMARDNFPGSEWLIADMRQIALNRHFAGVMAWDSFFHLSFDDQRRMFPVFRAHAAPGAPLLFTSGPRHGEAIGELHGEPLYHASLDPDEYRGLLTANGFKVIDARMEDPDCGGHSVWLAQRIESR